MANLKALGANIKKYRRECGLTQGELAEKLYLTAQNVSKWETGKSYPDVNNLCKLANVLGKNVDSLLSESSDDTETFIAIDGGGTKTEFCLVDKSGVVKSRLVLGGTNPNAFGIDTTLSTLFAGIDRLRLNSSKIDTVYAGIAGCGLRVNQEQVQKELARRYPDIKCRVDGDIASIIYSTEKYADCIAVIMGTGSVVCAAKDGKLNRIGGYGYLFDNGYCGYTLGREAVIAALRDEDGTAEHTAITKMLEERLGGKVKDKVASLYSGTNDFIAGFAKIVFEAYDTGDAVAKRIITDAIKFTLTEIRTANEKFGTSREVIFAGGITSRKDIIEENLEKCEFNLTYPTLPPIYGAAVCAARACGTICDGFYESFKTSYEALKMRGEEK